MTAFTIRDLQNLTGIKAHTIRIWEQRYSFLKPQRTGTNIRYYSNDELKMILNVALLNRFGYKVSHINNMTAQAIEEKIAKLSSTDARIDCLLTQLISKMVDMDFDQLEQKLDEHSDHFGIDTTIRHLIYPFLQKVELLWQTNQSFPAQQHLVSKIIRQKLVAGLEQIVDESEADPLIVLFLPENEFDELGILYLHYLLKANQHRCLYLGASVPINDMVYISNHNKPIFVQTHLGSISPAFSLEKYLKQFRLKLPELPVFISGSITTEFCGQLPANTTFFNTLADAADFVEVHIGERNATT